jgi:hypothetical protein
MAPKPCLGSLVATSKGIRLRTVRPFKPKLRGWTLVVWGAGVFLLAVAALLWIVDFHRYNTAVPFLLLGAIALNVLSLALSRRVGTAETSRRRP